MNVKRKCYSLWIKWSLPNEKSVNRVQGYNKGQPRISLFQIRPLYRIEFALSIEFGSIDFGKKKIYTYVINTVYKYIYVSLSCSRLRSFVLATEKQLKNRDLPFNLMHKVLGTGNLTVEHSRLWLSRARAHQTSACYKESMEGFFFKAKNIKQPKDEISSKKYN